MRRRAFLQSVGGALTARMWQKAESQNLTDAFAWYRHASFIVHYDHHIFPDDQNIGSGCDPDQYRHYWRDIRPDFVQYISKGEPGLAAYPTKAGVPAPGLRRDILRLIREVTNEMNLKFVVYYSGLGDDLAGEQHPEWSRMDVNGNSLGSNMCVNRDYVDRRMLPMLGELIDWYAVDGFWVDDDVWRVGYCWCPQCRAKFQTKTGEPVPLDRHSPLWSRFVQFHRDGFAEYLRKVAGFVNAKNPQCLYASNWAYTTRQPESPPAFLHRISGDVPHYTPSAHWSSFETRFWTKRGIPYDVMVGDHLHYRQKDLYPLLAYTKSSAQFQRESAAVLANGGAITVWAVPNPDGSLVRARHKLMAEVSAFVRSRKELCLGTESVPSVAVLHSPLTNYQDANTLFGRSIAIDSVKGAHRVLVENHYHFDIINEEDLLLCLGEYRLVILAEQVHLSAKIVEALRRFVEKGGALVATGLTSTMVDGEAQAQPLLADVLGIELVERNQKRPCWVLIGEEAVIFDQDYQHIRPRGAEVAAWFLSSYRDDPVQVSKMPVMTVHRFGQGCAVYLSADFFRSFTETPNRLIREWLGAALLRASPRRMVDLDGPSTLEVALRHKNGNFILHLVNQGSVVAETDSDVTHGVDELPLVHRLRVWLELAHQPHEILLMPEEIVPEWQWLNDRVEVVVPEVQIHRAILIRM